MSLNILQLNCVFSEIEETLRFIQTCLVSENQN